MNNTYLSQEKSLSFPFPFLCYKHAKITKSRGFRKNKDLKGGGEKDLLILKSGWLFDLKDEIEL